jgi:hypothetical protein
VTSLPITGGTVNHVDIDNNGTMVPIDYGVVSDEFILSIGGGAEEISSPRTESLADSPRFVDALSNLPSDYEAVYYVDLSQAQTTGQDAAGALIGENGPFSNMLATPVAAGSAAESFAAVTYVDGGYRYTSGIVVVR